jgi:hypothetical protein
MSTSFFNTGYVRSDGLKNEGNKYFLEETKEAYYYHPLPKDKQNKFGDYEHQESLDGRFWSKMAFDERPKDTLSLNSKIEIEEIDNSFKLNFKISGANDVLVVIDLCFNEKGKLEGVIPGNEEDEYFLENGFAKYIVGNDIIEIGPGSFEHDYIRNLDGEVYSTHFGTIKGKGKHLFITGKVPYTHSLIIR